jgi:hypothetical protein
MASMSQAKRFRKESELLQMLEDSIDSGLVVRYFILMKVTVIVIPKILK